MGAIKDTHEVRQKGKELKLDANCRGEALPRQHIQGDMPTPNPPAHHTPLPTTHHTKWHPHMPREGMETQYTHRGHTVAWGMMHLPQGGLSAGMDRREVVMCPRRGIDSASGHPRAQK